MHRKAGEAGAFGATTTHRSHGGRRSCLRQGSCSSCSCFRPSSPPGQRPARSLTPAAPPCHVATGEGGEGEDDEDEDGEGLNTEEMEAMMAAGGEGEGEEEEEGEEGEEEDSDDDDDNDPYTEAEQQAAALDKFR